MCGRVYPEGQCYTAGHSAWQAFSIICLLLYVGILPLVFIFLAGRYMRLTDKAPFCALS